ncbi:hypothetical protein D3C73_1234120 [compost metagenome]
MILGKLERNVERVHVLLDPVRDLIADIFSRPVFVVDDTVIAVEIGAGGKLDAHAIHKHLEALFTYRHTRFLIELVLVHHLHKTE